MYSDSLVQNPFYEPYVIWFQQPKAKEKTSIYWGKIIFSLWWENKEISYSLSLLRVKVQRCWLGKKMLINNKSYVNIKSTICQYNNVKQWDTKKCLLPQESEGDLLLLTSGKDRPPSIMRPPDCHMMILTTFSNFFIIHFRKK